MLRHFLKDKKHIHGIMLVFQAVQLLNTLVFSEMAFTVGVSEGPILGILLVSAIILHSTHVLFVSFYIPKKWLIPYGIILFGSFFYQGSLMSLPSSELINNSSLKLSFVLANFIQTVQLIILFILVLTDSFRQHDSANYKFISAANAFIMIPVTFGLIMFGLDVMLPIQLLAGDAAIASTWFNEAVQTSCYAIAGIDLPVDLHISLKNLAAIESIFSHLFMVLLVGRMIGK